MIWWILVLVASVISYPFAVKYLAIQLPYARTIVISNFTLNLLLVLLAVGALSPLLTKRIWPKAPKWLFIPVACVLAVVCVYVLKFLGMRTRF